MEPERQQAPCDPDTYNVKQLARMPTEMTNRIIHNKVANNQSHRENRACNQTCDDAEPFHVRNLAQRSGSGTPGQ